MVYSRKPWLHRRVFNTVLYLFKIRIKRADEAIIRCVTNLQDELSAFTELFLYIYMLTFSTCILYGGLHKSASNLEEHITVLIDGTIYVHVYL